MNGRAVSKLDGNVAHEILCSYNVSISYVQQMHLTFNATRQLCHLQASCQ